MSEEQAIAVVTGASRGIGKAIAEALSNHYFVIGTATSSAGAEAITAALPNGTGLRLDVGDAQSVGDFLTAVAEIGQPAVLVNNAGITRDNLLLRMKQEEWEQVIDTNLTAVFTLSKAFLKGMTRARQGRIINISSVVGSMGNAGQSNYAASKAALGGFSRSLAREVGSRGITVNVVAPGFIDTDMTRELSEQQQQAMLTQIPLARLGAAEEVAAVVNFLASDAAAYISGETIHVNGGMYMS